ncbi:TPA: hypothetical protein SCR51_005164 [Citrobacter freundii]|uniref:hypothetical protein n=1 Tax=Citrobacter freundii TaxID=546 RepID=UPI0008FD7838|nr:hypothetical protein [Citrobacter freundii]ELK7474950.1 hypothetical protein [Citrobacter freundii]OIZ47324.1 hypothetical protein BEH70_26180 [Citrobacter freundii]HCB2886801.1 hypothetical protein [Citrobacter freundii]HEG1884702.1 hypothetical protein [Citrobacter freundii]
MSNFDTTSIVKANKQHRCCECYGAINPGEQYERVFIVHDGDSSHFKTCKACCTAREWLLNETDWPDDIDGEGHSYFFTMLRDHLREQGRDGDRKYAFRAYRFVVCMDKRRMAYANAYNAETVKIRDRSQQGAAQ